MGIFDKLKKSLGGGEPEPPPKKRRSRGGRGRGTGTGGGQGSGQNRNRQGGGQGRGQGSGSGSGNNRNRNRNRNRSGSGTGSGGGSGTQSGNRRSSSSRSRSGEGQSSGQRRVSRSGAQRGEGGSGGERQGNRSSNRNRNRSGGGDGNRNRNRSGGNNRNRSRQRQRVRRGSASSGSNRRVLDANERPAVPVKKQILINASDPNQIRVAIREQKRVVEVYVERKGRRSLAGNIYKGRVQNVLPGMEAAFVDIGLERNGFLYVDEVTPEAIDTDEKLPVSVVSGDDEQSTQGESTEDATAAAPAEGEGTSEAGGDAEPATEGDAESTDAEGDKAKPAASKRNNPKRMIGKRGNQAKQKIQELLKPGQEILVQVVKDPMGTKGCRLTTQYSIAGRYLVFVPGSEGLGVSRRLPDDERARLRDIVKEFDLEGSGGGLIVRTAAEGARAEDIGRDLQLLLALHEKLMEQSGGQRAPKLLYNEADLSLRLIRDLFNDEVESVVVDDKRQHQRIVTYLKRTSPLLIERLELYEGEQSIFEAYEVEEAIQSTLNKRVNLPGGGYLIIDYAEAFTVIDVNTGRNVGKTSLEETITKTNMEAAEEIVRQLRLRDIGGIIVVDFIDMNLMKNRDSVLEHFRKELSKDRTKTYLVEISPLGLVEMTRQNVSYGVREILTAQCETCDGRGVHVSDESHAIEVEGAIADMVESLDDAVEAVALDVAPGVHAVLAATAAKRREIDKRSGKHVVLFADPELERNSFAIRAQGSAEEIDGMPTPLVRGQQLKVTIDEVDPVDAADGLARAHGSTITIIDAGSDVGVEKTIQIEAADGDRAFATVVRPPRRRRKRGGRGRGKGGAAGAKDEALTEEEMVEDVEAAEEAVEVDESHIEIPERLVMLDEGEEDSDLEDDVEEDDDLEDGDDDLDDDDTDRDDEDDEDDVDGDDDGDDDDGEPSSSSDDSFDADDDEDDSEVDLDNDDRDDEDDEDEGEPVGVSQHGSASSESEAAAANRRRRRRGSRGGRNRNRNRSGGGGTGSSGGGGGSAS
jgi:ribonuclease G